MLHLACLKAYDDIHAVIHCHAKFCTMFAITHQPIPCVIEEVDVFVGGDVPVANYEFTGSQELADEVSKWVGDRAAVLMANHGLLTVGKSPKDALKIANLVEITAEIVWGAALLGELVPLPDVDHARRWPRSTRCSAACSEPPTTANQEGWVSSMTLPSVSSIACRRSPRLRLRSVQDLRTGIHRARRALLRCRPRGTRSVRRSSPSRPSISYSAKCMNSPSLHEVAVRADRSSTCRRRGDRRRGESRPNVSL